MHNAFRLQTPSQAIIKAQGKILCKFRLNSDFICLWRAAEDYRYQTAVDTGLGWGNSMIC